MRNISAKAFVAANLLIEFEDGSVSLRIPHGATLADVSENLDKLGKWHTGRPIFVSVCFNAANAGDHRRSPVRCLLSSSISEQGRARNDARAKPRPATLASHLAGLEIDRGRNPKLDDIRKQRETDRRAT